MNPSHPFSENKDLIRAMEEAPPTGGVPLPQQFLFTLERTRREALAARPAATAGPLPATGTRIPLPPTPAARSRPLPLRQILQWAAVVAVLGGLAALYLPQPNRTAATVTAKITLTAPGSVTGSTQPDIAWESRDKPGQPYDVWILPAEGDHLTAPALFKAEAVTSPVTFAALKPGKGQTDAALKPGGDYRVLICLAGAGRLAGVPVTFKVSPSTIP
jgi:hypothetical protein